MIRQQVLELSRENELASLNETIRFLVLAMEHDGDPTGNIERALRKLCADRDTIESRSHRGGLVDYDQRLHG